MISAWLKGKNDEGGTATIRGKRLGVYMTCVGLVFLIFFGKGMACAEPSPLPADQRQRIEALIGAVGNRSDVQFIRNGRAYSNATAARFLRGKWEAQAAGIRSAEDFIAKVGSFSSTTGKPYRIRFRDGREIPSALFLTDLLKAQREQRQD